MKIGSSITIEVIEPNNELVKYRCKIIEKNDKYIIVDYPIHVQTNKTTFIPIGTSVKVSYTNQKAVYQFYSEIVKKVESKIPALAISVPDKSEIERIQRRKYVRVDASVDIAIHSLNNSFAPFTTVTMDISGGGLSIILVKDKDIPMGDHVKVYISLPMLTGEYVYVIVDAEVVFMKTQNNVRSASLKFLNLDNHDQQTIIRYCFDKQRELRNKELL